MIVDTLENIGRYACLGENFPAAVRFVQEADLTALPLGVTQVEGEKVFVNLQSFTAAPHEPSWEAHAKYADIQLILRGSEKFGFAMKAQLHPLKEGTDFRSCTAEEAFYFDLHEGEYAIFLPGEPHDPCHSVADVPEDVLKLVVKVLVEA